MMLYSKIDESNALQRKIETLTAQNHQLMLQQQLINLSQSCGGSGSPLGSLPKMSPLNLTGATN